MENIKSNFENFKIEKIDIDQLKMIQGGDPPYDPIDGNKDPVRGVGGGSGNG
jgi:hypothetical protein